MTRARDLADSADKDIAGTLTLDGLTVDGNGSLLTLDNGSNPATLSNTNGNVTLDFDTTNAGRNYTIQGNNLDVFRASNGGDISFYEDTGTTPKFFWDASAESLGIGTTSPSRTLSVNGVSGFGNGTIETVISYSDRGIFGTQSNHDLEIRTNATEAMRIDSSGNVLVGQSITTVPGAGNTTAGTSIRGEDGVFISRTTSDTSASALQVNKTTGQGAIINIASGGATVGRIGVNTDRVYLATTSKGVCIDQSAARMIPTDASGNTNDANMDLGQSNGRWKDLYLSGGVYLGGTVADNMLDDYEYGFFEPTYAGSITNPSGVTYDSVVGNEGYYVKIGRAVFIQINIRTDAISDVGAGDLLISGLPFAAASVSGQGGVGSFAVGQSTAFAGEVPSSGYVSEGNTQILLFYRLTSDGASSPSQATDLGTGTNNNLVRISGTYYSTE